MDNDKTIKAKYLGLDEWFGDWYQCPYCTNRDVRSGDKFCAMCGQSLLDVLFNNSR